MLRDPNMQFGPWLPAGVPNRGKRTGASQMPPDLPIFRDFTAHLVQRLAKLGIMPPEGSKDVKFGTTMVLYRSVANRVLEVFLCVHTCFVVLEHLLCLCLQAQRVSAMKSASIRVNKTIRSYSTRQFVKRELLPLKNKIVAAVAQRDVVALNSYIKEGVALAKRLVSASNMAYTRVAKAAAAELALEAGILTLLKSVLTKDVVEAEAEYREALSSADGKQMGKLASVSYPAFIVIPIQQDCDNMIATRAVVERVRVVLESLTKRREAKATLVQGIESYDRTVIEKGLKVGLYAVLCMLSTRHLSVVSSWATT